MLPAVYEDCKMAVLRWRLLPPLGRTLLQLAAGLGAAAYVEHYSRDLGIAAPPRPAVAVQPPLAAALPASMFRALQMLLQGQRDCTSAVPLLVRQRAGCVQRSVDLLAAYEVLAGAALTISASLAPESAQVHC
jgi:hypothetical protein